MEAATTTLADSLLDDLDDLSDVEEAVDDRAEEGVAAVSDEQDGSDQKAAATTAVAAVAAVDGPLIDVDEEARRQQQAFRSLKGHDEAAGLDSKPSAVDGAARKLKRKRLLEDPTFKAHLSSIRSVPKSGSPPVRGGNGANGNDDDGEQHRLILATNRHLSNLATDLARAHTDLSRLYHPKFPELEELLADPYQYRAAVSVIGNEMDMTKCNDGLNEILSSNQIITISVAGSTTSGRPLTDDELSDVDEAASYIDRVQEVQNELTAFVVERMERLAPSVCALIGPSVAARLLGLAGGLAELSRIPSCNLQVLGQVRSSAAARGGMSSSHGKPHAGVLAECDLVTRCPSYLQKKALKAVAAKLALAARCDFVNVETGRARSAESGRKFRGEIESKIQKWEEPDKAQVVKALPKPDLTTKKRRGGKRIRRIKEKFEETELMKQANMRAFSTEVGEYGDDAMGLTLGMLDTKEGGALRQTAEKRKMRQANTKASRKRAIQMSSGATSGLASSMVFTPVQGLELVNPDANRDRVREANAKWFSDIAGFQSALPKKG